MSLFSKVRIIERRINEYDVWVDGVPVRGVAAYRVEGGRDQVTQVTLQFDVMADDVQIEMAEVLIDQQGARLNDGRA